MRVQTPNDVITVVFKNTAFHELSLDRKIATHKRLSEKYGHVTYIGGDTYRGDTKLQYRTYKQPKCHIHSIADENCWLCFPEPNKLKA
jgi:hypothetical protein